MELIYATLLICGTAVFFSVVLMGGRNPRPSRWAQDWLIADIYVPGMFLAVLLSVWLLARFFGELAARTGLVGLADAGVAAAIIAVTCVVLVKMKVGQRLARYARQEAEEQAGSIAEEGPVPLPGGVPAQVLTHLVEQLKLDPEWIRSLRCVTREAEGLPNQRWFRLFSPSEALQRKIAVRDYESLDKVPEMVLFSGSLDKGSQSVNLHPPITRKAA